MTEFFRPYYSRYSKNWVEIFRYLLAYRYIPKTCRDFQILLSGRLDYTREVEVVFITKASCMDYNTPKAYTPLSLTSFLYHNSGTGFQRLSTGRCVTELSCISIAAEEITRRVITAKTNLIYIDRRPSKYTKSPKRHNGDAIKHYVTYPGIGVRWVKKYSRCNGNNRADKLARRAMNQTLHGPALSHILPFTAKTESKDNTHKGIQRNVGWQKNLPSW